MADKLPDELLREILAPPLRVSDELFADSGQVSPFSKTEFSASVVLLVCKRWMRVCTPWLYETVVIRSEAQAQALSRALTRNPQFGRHIRKLRIEGAYGKFLPAVVNVATAVTDFCFTLAVLAAHDVTGLVDALRTFNPKRVILTLHQHVKNQKQDLVLETLCARIAEWTNLDTFVFPRYEVMFVRNVKDINGPCIADALALRDRPTVVVLPRTYITAFKGILPTVLCLAPNHALKSIVIPGLEDADRDRQWRKRLPPSLQGILRDPEARTQKPQAKAATQENIILPNPFFKPLSGAPEGVRTSIWTRILSFACERCKDDRSHWGFWFSGEHYDTETSLRLCSVSREFRALTLPILMEHGALARPLPAQALQAVLQAVPGIGARMKTLVATDGIWLHKMILAISNLRELEVQIDHHPSFDHIETSSLITLVASTLGHCLEVFSIHGSVRSSPVPTKALGQFTALKRLNLTCALKFKPSTHEVQMPNLTHLCMRGEISPGLLALSLPSLKELESDARSAVETGFLERHGSHIEVLNLPEVSRLEGRQFLSSVPALQSLVVGHWHVDSRIFWNQSHLSLTKLLLNWSAHKSNKSEWRNVFDALSAPGAYPALKEVKVGSLAWPTNEKEISRSDWPGFAEALAKNGTALVDKDGRRWRSRLRVQGE